jgi:hypothetical protein
VGGQSKPVYRNEKESDADRDPFPGEPDDYFELVPEEILHLIVTMTAEMMDSKICSITLLNEGGRNWKSQLPRPKRAHRKNLHQNRPEHQRPAVKNGADRGAGCDPQLLHVPTLR